MAENGRGEVGPWLRGWQARGDAAALVDGASGEVWSYRKLSEVVESRAKLGALAGVKAGERVLVTGAGGPGWVASLFAVAALRAVAAPAMGRSEAREAELAEAAGARWRLDGGGGLMQTEVAIETVRQRGAVAALAELRRRGHAGLVLFTSGTTGRPKGVVHDFEAHLEGWRSRAREGAPVHRVLVLPRPDQTAGMDVIGRGLAGGAVLVLPAVREPEAVAALLVRERVDVLPATASFLHLLLQSAAGPGLAASSLRLVPYGAEPMPAARLARLRAAWPKVTFVPRFGTTETGAVRVEAAGPDGAGMVPVDADVAWRIADGELQVKSPRQLLGYLDPADGREVLTADGWYRTGDLAEPVDGGGFRLLGRRVAQINVGGRKVRPEAVEAVLVGHPEVVAAKVEGAPHALLGEQVVATVEARPGAPAAAPLRASLRAWLAARLEAHEVPSRWVFAPVEVEPESGKLRRR